MTRVRFFREDVTLEVQPGEGLRELALRAGIELYRSWHKPMNCKGKGKCGSCRVEVSIEDSVIPERRTPPEKRFLDKKFADTTTRLACQVRVTKDLSVLTQEVRGRRIVTRAFIPRGF